MGFMNKIILKFLFQVEYFFQGLLFPFFFLLQCFSKKLAIRYKEELSFNKVPLVLGPRYSFEVSSEGEYEQVAPILFYFLGKKIPVQLIISSSSLAKKAHLLAKEYPLLDVRMVPLLSFFWVSTPFSSNLRTLVKAKHLILCRYDFFPELMLIGSRKEVKFTLLSASLKNKKRQGLKGYYWKGLYSFFDLMIPASQQEESSFESLFPGLKTLSFDFRQIQIKKRLDLATTHLNQWQAFLPFKKKLEQYNKEKRIIIGSCWKEDCQILENQQFQEALLNRQLLLTIIPHKLDDAHLEEIISEVKKINSRLVVEIVEDEMKEGPNASVYIIKKKGVLAELYGLFGHAFVGGGYGRSIHSVLEPFLADCYVYCGPKVHRSTEFDFIDSKRPSHLQVVSSQHLFFGLLEDKMQKKEDEFTLPTASELDQEFKIVIGKITEEI